MKNINEKGVGAVTGDSVLQITQNNEAGYHPLASYEGWLVAVLNQGDENDSLEDVGYLEYHARTDEVFMLLKGDASLIIGGNGKMPEDIHIVKMQPQKCYNVKAGVWHSLVLTNDGSVVIVENSDTGKHNSEYYYLNEHEKNELIKLDESR